jgi:peptidoglycan/xylan/chitin deacetylase (PgdA/CDA1 family)
LLDACSDSGVTAASMTGPQPPASAREATTATLPADLTGHDIWRIPTARHVVALTFDGGSGAQGVRPVLSALSAADIRATFFLTGQFAKTYPKRTARIASYVVGNHTMTHPHLTKLTSPEVRAEVSAGAKALRPALGGSPRPWVRFPFGEYDARTLGVVNDMGYAAIGWTVDTLGWEGRHGGGSVDDIVQRVMAKLQPGAIVLMHLGAAPDGSTLDADALPSLIAAIRDAGYSFVTVRILIQ